MAHSGGCVMEHEPIYVVQADNGDEIRLLCGSCQQPSGLSYLEVNRSTTISLASLVAHADKHTASHHAASLSRQSA